MAPLWVGTSWKMNKTLDEARGYARELGHSERREHFGETDATVALKVRAALDAGLVPLVCVGEPAAVRDGGDAVDHVVGHVRAGPARVAADEVGSVVVAYEPVWAIGEHGRPATVEETGPAMAAVAAALGDLSGGTGPRALLYGGSVHPGNAAELLADPHADGCSPDGRRGRRPGCSPW